MAGPNGKAGVALTAGAPALPAGRIRAGSGPVTVRLGTSTFRLDLARRDGSWLVAGQSLAEQQHTMNVLRGGEALVGPVLLLAMFAGSLIIGLRALSPVEQSRRRQLEFTADASHELRTPLSVISAEIGIALSAPRPAADYQAALLRIGDESQRLRRIVEDLLWLARFDSQPPPPGDEPLDLCTIAGQCADRFAAVARSQSLDISVTVPPAQAAWISAPPEWIDRLAGVLVDNACRYAGQGGSVRLGVSARGSRVSLTVEDSGPGIPAAQRHRLFDRFHRLTGDGAAGHGPPPRGRRPGRRGRAGAGHRRLDRAVNRRALADRRVTARRRAVRGVLAAPRRAGTRRAATARCARTRPGARAGSRSRPGPAEAPGPMAGAGCAADRDARHFPLSNGPGCPGLGWPGEQPAGPFPRRYRRDQLGVCPAGGGPGHRPVSDHPGADADPPAPGRGAGAARGRPGSRPGPRAARAP